MRALIGIHTPAFSQLIWALDQSAITQGGLVKIPMAHVSFPWKHLKPAWGAADQFPVK